MAKEILKCSSGSGDDDIVEQVFTIYTNLAKKNPISIANLLFPRKYLMGSHAMLIGKIVCAGMECEVISYVLKALNLA